MLSGSFKPLVALIHHKLPFRSGDLVGRIKVNSITHILLLVRLDYSSRGSSYSVSSTTCAYGDTYAMLCGTGDSYLHEIQKGASLELAVSRLDVSEEGDTRKYIHDLYHRPSFIPV